MAARSLGTRAAKRSGANRRSRRARRSGTAERGRSMATYRMTMLVCADLARSRDFYRDVIGLKVGIDEPPHWVDFPLGGGIELGLHPVSDEMSLQPGSMSLGFAVDDVDAAIAGMK